MEEAGVLVAAGVEAMAVAATVVAVRARVVQGGVLAVARERREPAAAQEGECAAAAGLETAGAAATAPKAAGRAVGAA